MALEEDQALVSGTHIKRLLAQFLAHKFSPFRLLGPFNTDLHVVLITSHKIILLLLRSCNCATVMNCNFNTWYAGSLICNHQRGHNPRVETHCPSVWGADTLFWLSQAPAVTSHIHMNSYTFSLFLPPHHTHTFVKKKITFKTGF